MSTRKPLDVVVASRKKAIERLRKDRAKIADQLKKRLAEYDAQIKAEETFLAEVEKLAAPEPVANNKQ